MLVHILGVAAGAIATFLVIATFLALSSAHRDAAKCAAIATIKMQDDPSELRDLAEWYRQLAHVGREHHRRAR